MIEIPRKLAIFWWMMDAIEKGEKIHVINTKGEEYKPLVLNTVDEKIFK